MRATIAWALEAFENGDIGVEECDGLQLEWGDINTIINHVLPTIAEKRGGWVSFLPVGSGRSQEIRFKNKGI